MDHLTAPPESVKHVAKSAERVLIAVITSRTTIPFFLCAAVCIVAFRLPPESLERIFLRLIDARWFTLLGWALLVVALVGGWRLFKWREAQHAAHVAELISIRDRLVEKQLDLKLESPPLKLENK
jgi:hypothetical protein